MLINTIELSNTDRRYLLKLARESIHHGFLNHRALNINEDKLGAALKQIASCFVTLNLNHKLRGCIGSLQATQTLAADVSNHAFAAAFQDPRFSPLREEEFNQIEISISVLGPKEQIQASSEAELLARLRPDIDGLVLDDKNRRATFLPSVWQQIPNKLTFLNALREKAGFPDNYWSSTLKAYRYQSVHFEEADFR